MANRKTIKKKARLEAKRLAEQQTLIKIANPSQNVGNSNKTTMVKEISHSRDLRNRRNGGIYGKEK